MSAEPNWMDWQREHADALRALQEAQRVYHRAVSGQAFASLDAATMAATKDALHAMDHARIVLDEVRAREPR